MAELPTEAELRDRILRQQGWAQDKYTATLIWKGYLAGLFEWSLIDLEVYTRLAKLLSTDGNVEISELFGDEPLSDERRKAVESYAVKRGS
jgi:hypothetical protein